MADRYIRLAFALIAPALLSALPSAVVAQTMAGKEFVVALPSLWRQADLLPIGNFQITIMCSRRTNVTVKWSGPDGGIVDQGTIEAGNRLTIQPPRFPVVNLIQKNNDRDTVVVNQRSFHIQTDQPVSVFALYDQYDTSHITFRSKTEMWGVPPIQTYDTSYIMNVVSSDTPGRKTGFLIIAAEDGTVVDFDPTARWGYVSPETPVPGHVELNRYQVYQVLSWANGGNLSGTTIRSNKPIAVMSFSLGTSIDGERSSTLAEFLPPASLGGKEFYTAPFGTQSSSRVKVVAFDDDTRISVNGILLKTLNRTERYTIGVDGPTHISSTKPVVAMQFSRSGDVEGTDTTLFPDPDSPTEGVVVRTLIGNPAMAWLPPVDQYKPTLQWTNPLVEHRRAKINSSDPSLFLYPWHHYALITAPTSALASVRIDGQPVNFQFTHVDGEFASAVVPVLPKQHLLTADAPVMCIPYGFAWDDSYAFVSGEALRSIAFLSTDSIVASTCDTLLDVFFDIENKGNNNFRIDSIKADGIEIVNIQDPIGFPTEMPPGRQLPAHILVRMPQPGTYIGTFRIYTDANNQALLELPFRVTRDSAKLSYPQSIDFGQIAADETSTDTTITITNDGETDLTITSLSIDDPRFQILDPSPPLTIPPGGSRTVGVRITPRAGVPERGTLTIIGEPCFTPVSIDFSGFQGAGPLIGTPRSIQFPPFLCDAPEFTDTTIVLTAIGDEPLSIDNIAITGQNPAMFSLIRNPAPLTIAPQQSDSLIIRYTPTTFGLHRAMLDIRSNARNATDPLQISLAGRLDTAMILPNRRTIDFGQLLDCDDPIELQLGLTNGGTVDANVEGIIEGDQGFALTQSDPFIVPAIGTERVVTLRFAPESDGDFTATLRLRGEPCGIDEIVTLKGSRRSASLTANLPQIDFDTVYLCDGATSRSVTLTNDGPVADTITRFSPAGSDAFRLSPESYPIILQPGESYSFTLEFDPQIGADVSGSLEFFWGPCDKSTRVDFRGVGAEPRVSLSAQAIDFGQVDIAAATPARRSVTLRNEGNAPRTISSIDLGGVGSLTVVAPASFPVTLQPGEELTIEIDFMPTTIGLLNASAIMQIDDPCAEQLSFGITGEGTGTKVIDLSLRIRVPENITGQVDRLVSIPVEITDGINLLEGALRQIDVTLSWRYTMLLPQSIRTDLPGVSTRILDDRIVGDRRVLRVGFFGADDGSSFPADGVLGQISALVLLGDRLQTEISVDTVTVVTPPDRQFSYGRDDGGFTLEGYCELDGGRLVSLSSVGAKLSAPRPNPVTGVSRMALEVVGIEGYAEVVLYDAMGIERGVLHRGEVRTGVYDVAVSSAEWPSGMYFCELRFNGLRQRQAVIIER